MPKYVGNNRTLKEIMDKIQNEREQNPELDEKMEEYENKLQDWYQNYFADFYGATRYGFDSYIQLGGTSFHEILKDHKYVDKDDQITILSALAASMELENKKDTFQIFLPDGKGNVKPRPIVNSEKVISSPKKAEISLWDSFCNLLGYKTEKYKAYEAQQKQEEMQKQLEKDQAELVKKELLSDAKEGSRRAEKTLYNIETVAKHVTQDEKDLLRTLFGKENIGDWQLSDGTRLSPKAVITGVLQSKEVGEPELFKEILKNTSLEQVAEKYPGQWEKACKICQSLAEKKEKVEEMDKKFQALNEFLFEEKKSEYSKKMEQDLLKHLIPHEKADFDFMKDREDKLCALGGTGEEYYQYYNVIQAKGQLHKFLKDEKLALSPEEEIVKEGIYQASLVKKTEQALEDEDYEKAAQLNDKLIKSQVYSNSLQRIVATQMQQASNGKEVTELATQDMKRLKRLIDIKVEGTGLTEDKRPLSVIKTSSMAIQGVTSQYLKMEITLDDKFGLKGAALKTATFREELGTSENILRCFDEQKAITEYGVAAEIDGELVEQRMINMDDVEHIMDDMNPEMDSDMDYDMDESIL